MTTKSNSSTGEQETGELKPCAVCSFHWDQIVMPGETHNRNCPHYYDEEKGCACQLCGNRFKVDVNVSDDLWQQVSSGKEMVCGLCVLRAVEKLNKFASCDLIDTDTHAELEKERGALLRSLIPRLCDHCNNGVFPLREWSDGKAFTHWNGYEQLACTASDVRIFLAHAAQETKQND